MNIWFGQQLPAPLLPSAVTIGNFDGVHTGHRHILERLAREAQARQLHSVAIIFEPQPNEFFSRQANRPLPQRITPLRDKIQLLQQTGSVNSVWVQRFNPQFAAQTAEQFIQTILRAQLNTRYLLIGDDFRFGKGRGGDFSLLAAQRDFETERTPSILIAGERASSTAIRQALQTGDVAAANQMLGHPYTLSGHVKYGKKLGRTIGCPTANVHLPLHRYPLSGVFVVRAKGSFGECDGVASFGTNPTVSHTPEAKLEVHLFDFSGRLYGERIQVTFLHKLRDEAKFDSIAALQTQIAQDIETARAWHQEHRDAEAACGA